MSITIEEIAIGVATIVILGVAVIVASKQREVIVPAFIPKPECAMPQQQSPVVWPSRAWADI